MNERTEPLAGSCIQSVRQGIVAVCHGERAGSADLIDPLPVQGSSETYMDVSSVDTIDREAGYTLGT
ncbi:MULTISPECIES: hypothetical protein [Paenibacillus]|uniref:hypothetical protein n=1 Tax=Paenibacillus TaxID=44249 RepID=UPI0020C96CCA|nr:hypothetical protein [Paenibacillus odorifer]